MSYADLEHEDLLLSGHRLVSVAAYGLPSKPSYAAIWHPVSGTPRFRKLIESHSLEGPVEAGTDLPPGLILPVAQVAPTLVTATGDARPNGELGTATLWVYDIYDADEELPSRPTIITDDVGYLLKKAAGRRCFFDAVWFHREVNVFGYAGKGPGVRYVAVTKSSPTAIEGIFAPPKGVLDGRVGIMDSPRIRDARAGFKRIHAAIPSPKTKDGRRQVAVQMLADSYVTWPADPEADFNGGCVTDGPMTGAELHAQYHERREQRWVPIHVGANGHGTHARFCMTWARSYSPKPRYFWLNTTTQKSVLRIRGGQADKPDNERFEGFDKASMFDLAGLQTKLMARMQTINCSNAQIAVAVDGQLKLCWSLTLGQPGWRNTQPSNKMRFGSCAKFLTAMRYAALGEKYLKMSLAEALKVFTPFSTAAELAKIRVEDCLRMVSGLTTSNLIDHLWLDGAQELPLVTGAYTSALLGGLPVAMLVKNPPRTKEAYNNTGFALLGEAIGSQLGNDPSSYLDEMQKWWPISSGNVEIIPGSKTRSLEIGETPMVDRSCIQRNTWTTKAIEEELTESGQLPPYIASAYAFNDGSTKASSGTLTMSAATMVRLLQMLHPVESQTSVLSAAKRLTLEQVRRLATSQSPPPSGAEKFYGLGCDFVATDDSIDFSKGGTLGTGKSTVHHHVRFATPEDASTIHTFSIATVTNVKQVLAGADLDSFIYQSVRRIFDRGMNSAVREGKGFFNDVDLFPELALA